MEVLTKEDKTEAVAAAAAFSFWGATKKSGSSAGAGASKGGGRDEIAPADKAKLPEAANVTTIEKDTTSSWKSTLPPMKASAVTKKPVAGKIADRLKAFESPKDAAAPPPPPPPPAPPTPPEEDKKKSISSKSPKSPLVSKKAKDSVDDKSVAPKKSSKPKAVPGSFPTDAVDDELIDIVEMPIDKKPSKKSKSPSKEKEALIEEVEPAAPPTPPPESKSKKERPRVVRDGSSWGAWGAAPRKEEKRPSKERKTDDSPAKELKEEKRPKDSDVKRSKSSRKPSDKDDKVSKNSSSDKDDRPPKSRGLSAMFGSAPPLSRSKSVSERRTSTSGRTSSRRQSAVLDGAGIMSPPPDDAKDPPEMSAKAARMLGVTPGKLARGKSESKTKSRGKTISHKVNHLR